jgi:hypothetical protein
VQRQFLALLPLFGTKDFPEGLAAFLEKRPPELTGHWAAAATSVETPPRVGSGAVQAGTTVRPWRLSDRV